ncbi:unnamed protein product [Mortierella alpina]
MAVGASTATLFSCIVSNPGDNRFLITNNIYLHRLHHHHLHHPHLAGGIKRKNQERKKKLGSSHPVFGFAKNSPEVIPRFCSKRLRGVSIKHMYSSSTSYTFDDGTALGWFFFSLLLLHNQSQWTCTMQPV